tara:strand:- start:6565 stop:6768 length:204 start_codon:yes stop_codon:yes gene_type:complete
MAEAVPVTMRIFDPERRGFESARDYVDVDMLFMTHVEAAARAGRSVQIDPMTKAAAPRASRPEGGHG